MAFISRRILFYVIAAWGAITANFFIPRAMPGNPAETMLAKYPKLPPSAYKALQAAFGFGHAGSLWHQYWTYLIDLAHGNLGLDLTQYPATVSSLLIATVPWTLILVGTATVIAFVLGTALGICAAWWRSGWFDRLLPALTFLQAVPYFFFALVAVQLLAMHWHLFPAERGYANGIIEGWHWNFVLSAAYHSLLPAFTIIITSVAAWMLGMRNVMITTIGEDYVWAAQAKGLAMRRVLFSYAARNAILPSISAFALSLGFVVSGAIVMEIVFSYPGLGLLLQNAVTSEDYPMVQAIFLIIALAVLVANLLADVVYVAIDPRSRRSAAQ
jgi:peptide/nickel transport system permease protein